MRLTPGEEIRSPPLTTSLNSRMRRDLRVSKTRDQFGAIPLKAAALAEVANLQKERVRW
jgi:hypothetical protein